MSDMIRLRRLGSHVNCRRMRHDDDESHPRSIVSSISSVQTRVSADADAKPNSPPQIPLEIVIRKPERLKRKILFKGLLEHVRIRRCWEVLVAANLLLFCMSSVTRILFAFQGFERIRKGVALGVLGLYTLWKGYSNVRVTLSSIAVCLVALSGCFSVAHAVSDLDTCWGRTACWGGGIIGDVVTSLPHTIGSTSVLRGRTFCIVSGAFAAAVGLLIQAAVIYRSQHPGRLGEVITWMGIFLLNASALVESKVVPKGSMFLARRIQNYRRMALAFLGPLLLWVWLYLPRAMGSFTSFTDILEPKYAVTATIQYMETAAALLRRTSLQHGYKQTVNFAHKLFSIGVRDCLERIIDYTRSVDFVKMMPRPHKPFPIGVHHCLDRIIDYTRSVDIVKTMQRLAIFFEFRRGYQRPAGSTAKKSLATSSSNIAGAKIHLEDQTAALFEDAQACHNPSLAAETTTSRHDEPMDESIDFAVAQTDSPEEIQQNVCHTSEWLEFTLSSLFDISSSESNSINGVDDGAAGFSYQVLWGESDTSHVDRLRHNSHFEESDFQWESDPLSSGAPNRMSNASGVDKKRGCWGQDPEAVEIDAELSQPSIQERPEQLGELVCLDFVGGQLQSEFCAELDSYSDPSGKAGSRLKSKDKNRSRSRKFQNLNALWLVDPYFDMQ